MKKAIFILFFIILFVSCREAPPVPEYISDENYNLTIDLFNPVYKDERYHLFYTYDKKEYILYSDKSLYGGHNKNKYFGTLFEGEWESIASLFLESGFKSGYSKEYFSENLYRLWEMTESGDLLFEMKDGSLFFGAVHKDPTAEKRESILLMYPCEKEKALYIAKRDDTTFLEYDFDASFAGFTDEYFFPSLNAEKYYISSVKHLPINKYETKEELDLWLKAKGERVSLDEDYDEIPSVNDTVKKYDEDFFKEYTLFSVYVQSNSGSYRYAPSGIVLKDGALRVFVGKTNDLEVVTDDMSGSLLFISLKKTELEGVTEFDAVEGIVAINY